MMRNPEQTIGNMIDKSGVAYISYVDKDGYPQTRAMLPPRERDGISTIWFTTNTSSQKVAAFRENAKASVYFVDRRFYRGVCLTGTVEVITSAEDKVRIWRDGDEKYYAGGVTDPDYCVLKFTAVRGRYYSSFKSEDFVI